MSFLYLLQQSSMKAAVLKHCINCLLLEKKMFATAVNNAVKSLGDDVYIPSPSLAASQDLCPLGLVIRKAKRFLSQKRFHCHRSTNFELKDVMKDWDIEVGYMLVETEKFLLAVYI